MITHYKWNNTGSVGIVAQEIMRIDSNGNMGIGTTIPGMSINAYNEWQDMLKISENNPAVKKALDQLRTTYYLSKDNGSET